MGFIGCSERQPSWLSEFSEFNVAGGWLAGWIRWQCQISDINHQPPPLLLLPPLSAAMPFYSPLLLSSSSILLHPTSAVEPVNTNHPFYCNSPSVSIYLCISFHLPVLLFLSPVVSQTHMHIQRSSRQADSAGFVMNGILLHIRRKYTLQCGFVSIVLGMTHSTLQRMAVSQTVRQTDSTAQTDRLVCRAYRQTAQEKQTERQIVCDRYSQPTTEADNLPIQKRPATSGYRHQMKEMGNAHRQAAECCTFVFNQNMIFLFCKVIK